MPKFTFFISWESVPVSRRKQQLQINWTPNIVSESNQVIRDWIRRCIKDYNLRGYEAVNSIAAIHPLGFLFMDSQLQDDGYFFVRALFLPHCLSEESIKRASLTFTDTCLNNLAAQLVISNFSSMFERLPSAEQIKVAYETAFGCKEPMKRFCMVCHPTIGTGNKITGDCYFNELGYGYIIGQKHQGDTTTFNDQKAKQIQSTSFMLNRMVIIVPKSDISQDIGLQISKIFAPMVVS